MTIILKANLKTFNGKQKRHRENLRGKNELSALEHLGQPTRSRSSGSQLEQAVTKECTTFCSSCRLVSSNSFLELGEVHENPSWDFFN